MHVVKFLMILPVLLIINLLLQQTDRYEALRKRMVSTQIADRGIRNPLVLESMEKVPRHLFVPEEYRDEAYNDYPLPIGYGQTISQPFIVAYMTEVLKPEGSMKALEIGTGSGYQAAVLAEIVEKVYTVEIVRELAKESAVRLRELGYDNVICRHGDSYQGCTEHAPFDLIVVTAAAESIPQPLIDQLAENGRLVIPVGKPTAVQELILLEKRKGRIYRRRLTFVRFVPFTRTGS
ncbi:MAG TPA: protein-L-isoaspartate(D-aspartate) O-methyltransferase [Bacteroidales bacterium]|nr:protein-L-isoaspartate(D-aspartate) O-methyltransferase [Bacteroidales bacterium]